MHIVHLISLTCSLVLRRRQNIGGQILQYTNFDWNFV